MNRVHQACSAVLAVLALTMTTAIAPPAAADPALSNGVYPDAQSVKPLSVGQPLPSATLRNLDGESVDLSKLVGESGALLVFYRGGW